MGLTKFTLFGTDDVMYKNTTGILTRIKHAPNYVWRESQFQQQLTVDHSSITFETTVVTKQTAVTKAR